MLSLNHVVNKCDIVQVFFTSCLVSTHLLWHSAVIYDVILP
jgi:hypothetical protein